MTFLPLLPALLAAGVAAGPAAAPPASAGLPDPSAAARETLALAARGSPASLAAAVAVVPDAVRLDPAWRGAAANRALARLLAASDLREVAAASPDGEEGLRRARALRDEALEELRPLARAASDDPAVLRALAVYDGLGGDVARVAAARERLRGPGAEDPWLAFAAAYAEARALPAAAAVARLAAFVEANPGVLPPRMTVARLQLALGARDDALATLDALLVADPEHDGAQELKAALLAPPPTLAPPPVPAADPPRRAPGFLPRKPGAARGSAAPASRG